MEAETGEGGMKDKHCEEGFKAAGGYFLLMFALLVGAALILLGVWDPEVALKFFVIGLGVNICALPFSYIFFSALEERKDREP
jgi:hypothetical protein